jgi:hypothetical protein
MARNLIGVFLVAVCVFLTHRAGADDGAEFHAAVARAALHYHAALDRLRAQDAEGTTAELNRMRAAWQVLVDRFGATRPEVFAADGGYATILTDVDARIVAALIVIGIGRPAAARDALAPVGDMLLRLRVRGTSP